MWKKNKDETLQDKLQEQERADNRITNIVKIGAILVILLACAGGIFPKLYEWADIDGERAFATATAYAAAEAQETAVALDRLGIKKGWEDPAEVVKLGIEQWYGADYKDDFEDWAKEMCQYTTQYACDQEVYNIGGENWKNNVVPQKLQLVSIVTPVKVVWDQPYYDSGLDRNVKAQVWEYDVVVNDRPGEKFTRYVMIADQGAGWLMVHNLWEEEAAELLQEISADQPTEVPTT